MQLMCRRGLTALAAVVVFSLTLAAKPNFGGDWKLSAAKSDFGPFPGLSAMTQKVTHQDPSLKTASKMSSDNGDFEFEASYSTDGKETTNQFGPSSMKSTGKWEGDTLVIEILPATGGPKRWVYRGQGSQVAPIAGAPGGGGRYSIFGPSDGPGDANGFMRVSVESGEAQLIGISASQDGQVQFPRRLGVMHVNPKGRQLIYVAGGEGGGSKIRALDHFLPKAAK